ncbi:MAG: hypothetical protein Q4B67_05805 [Eubacteriales bacterium]|nr:hypothetical protein [Eubacteriales bacterium]
MRKIYLNKNIRILFTAFVFVMLFVMTAFAKERLKTPIPVTTGKYTIRWDKVSGAASYDIRVSVDDEKGRTTYSVSTSSTSFDMSPYAAGGEARFQIRALPKNSSQTYYSSDWAEYGESFEPEENNTVYGRFSFSSSYATFSNFDGVRVTGWQFINGYWYYFTPSNGRTVTGWQLIDGSYYNFDEFFRMRTGWYAYDYNWYFLTSSGKMAKGWASAGPNAEYYFNNDGENPVGALDIAKTHSRNPNLNPPYELVRPDQPGTSGPGPGGNPGGTTGGGGGSQQNPSSNPQAQWITNPNGTWSYKNASGRLVYGWQQINGRYYYFNSQAVMMTGWQYIGNRWYYLEPNKGDSNGYPEGAMWSNATTPDGYYVNNEGQWTVNGVVQTAAPGSGSSGSTGTNTTNISRVNINYRYDRNNVGELRSIVITDASYCDIISQSASKSYESWSTGDTITYTLELGAKNGYSFTTNTNFVSNSDLKIITNQGDNKNRTLWLEYTPTMKLKAPDGFYLDSSNTLRWVPVKSAKRYRVKITGTYNGTVSKIITEPELNLYEYGDPENDDMTVTVSALGNEGSRTVSESDSTRVSVFDLEQSRVVDGEFRYEGSKLKYYNELGEAVTGWQQILGNWYHFKKNGYADGPGWFQDTSEHWYYFDSAHRMMVGTINDGGKQYFMNDGSNKDFPYGAWVH